MLDARTTELEPCNSEYGERVDLRAATIDVLEAMSASPGDPQPVCDLIAQRDAAVAGAYSVSDQWTAEALISVSTESSVSRARRCSSAPVPL